MNEPIGRSVGIREAVHVVEGAANLPAEVGRDHGRDALRLRIEDLQERRTIDVLEDQEQLSVLIAEVERLHDILVMQAREDARLVREHGHELGVGGVHRRQALEDNLAPESGSAPHPGPEDIGHAALPQMAHELIAPARPEAGDGHGSSPPLPSI